MKIKFYNTLSRKKEIFTPLSKKEVKMYSCGPTVYNYPHIGNYRAYIFADTLKRVLIYQGYKVKHIMNLTDIDDKTIRESQKEGKTLKEFTEFYTKEFFKDIKSLNITNPKKFTKATSYVKEMVKIIEKLLQKKLAYKSEDGSVYFDIKKFKNYGKLSHLVLKNQKENAGGRIKKDEYDKDSAEDFALWKAWDEKDGDVFWKTKLGKGRPGWHIECSAMSIANLGAQLDIHTGGVDNIFPHHENEIAQSEGATGKHFVKYWMHNEWVLVDNKKMSKSEKNFFTLRDLLEQNINPVAYRFWLLMANYRTRVNFIWEALEGAETALKRLYSLYIALGTKVGKIDKKYQKKFAECITDDLDTPRALVVLWDVIRDENVSKADRKATILDFDKVLGLGFKNLKEAKEIEIPENIQSIIKEREQARKNKDFKNSDELRDKIKSLGYEVKDTEEGQKISKI
ncbi:MAG: cysteine--tRNA ligase [Patescibacteria group bacterium]